ncbi:MAG: fimbrillin family protein, partial [Mediterranea sp.]|nr:fimbrillin family protein [Mediterranea sp.]
GNIADYDLTATYWKNRKYTVDASFKLNPDGMANQLYFPLNGSDARFVAYYPYAAGVTATGKMSFDFTDQSDKEKKEAKDFCFYRGTTPYSKGGATPQFEFSHRFSKIRVTVKQRTGGLSVKDIQMKLSGMPKIAEVDLNKLSQAQTDGITVGTAVTNVTEITACTLSGSTDAEATVEAIVAPHSATGDFAKKVLTFTTAKGEIKSYELPKRTFNAGYSYSFTFVLDAATKVADGMTNCYIVAPGTELTFPVSRAYTHDGTNFTTTLHTGDTYTGTFIAYDIWADAAVISGTPTVTGSGNTAKVTVKTNASVTGNAVVKICRLDNGETVWSYHIWVTDYNPTQNTYTNMYTFSSKQYEFIFMDRNLGATFAGWGSVSFGSGFGTGLFYQWGRKDPFPATDAVTTGSWSKNETSPTLGTIAGSIKNPGVFLLEVSGSEYDWLYASSNNTLWGHAANGGTKTIYDPCPSGWRVPVNSDLSEYTSPWKGFTRYNGGTFYSGGYDWGTNAVYPAAGYRIPSSGSLNSVGAYGLYWSASPASSTSNGASYLDFFDNYVNGNYSGAGSTYGFSVRCSQE